jgi:type IV secretion system protein VirD4
LYGLWLATGALAVVVALYLLGLLVLFLAHLAQSGLDMETAIAGWREEAAYPLHVIRRTFRDPAVQPYTLSTGVLLLCGVASLAVGGQGRPSRPSLASGYGSHGTGRWATEGEVAQNFADDGPGAVLGRVRSGMGWRHVIHPFESKLRNRFVVIFGPPGSAKTTGYVLPNLLHAVRVDQGRSLMMCDPKAELYRNTAHLFRQAGLQVRVINLDNPTHSDRYNPLDYVHTLEDALRLANTIIANTSAGEARGDPFWVNAEKTLLACLIWYVKGRLSAEDQHLGTVLHLGNAFARDQNLMEAAFAELPPAHGARQLYNVIAALTDKTRDGVFVGFAVRLQLWASEQITALTASSDFNLRELGRRPTVLYLIIPDHHTTYRALTSLFFDQAFQELIAEAEAQGGRLPVEVRIVLEELANIGRIPDLDKRLATIRSRGLIVELVLQTLGQLESLYGDTWETIIGCSDTVVVLGANDLKSAEYISKRLGTATIRTSSTSLTQAERGQAESLSYHYTSRPLLLPDEVQGQGEGGLQQDEVLVIQRGLPPVRIRKCFVWEFPGQEEIEAADPAAYQPPGRKEVKLPDPYGLASRPDPPRWVRTDKRKETRT